MSGKKKIHEAETAESN